MLAGYFNFSAQEEWQLALRFNIAPTQTVPVVRQGATGRELAIMRWGLIPSWAKDMKLAATMINARAETVAEKPAFRSAFKRRRCLVPADGYYEWQKIDAKTKQPYYIRRRDDQPFAFAGLWERWDKGSDPIESFTIITSDANDSTRSIHDRSPVILDPSDFDMWLDPAFEGVDHLRTLLTPRQAAELVATPVSTYVNSPKNIGPECIAPLAV